MVVFAGLVGMGCAVAAIAGASVSLVAIAPDMRLAPWMVLIGTVSLVVLGVAGSALPTWRAISLPTVDVLRQGRVLG